MENDIHGKSAFQAFIERLGGRHPILNIILFTDLQGSINRIHRTIELMYSDKSIMQVSGVLSKVCMFNARGPFT